MTTRLDEPSWLPRALARAEALQGLPWTEKEQEHIDIWEEHDPGFGIFMAYGICPERQSYINGTIEILREAEEMAGRELRGKVLIAWVRLCWSCEMLIGGVDRI